MNLLFYCFLGFLMFAWAAARHNSTLNLLVLHLQNVVKICGCVAPFPIKTYVLWGPHLHLAVIVYYFINQFIFIIFLDFWCWLELRLNELLERGMESMKHSLAQYCGRIQYLKDPLRVLHKCLRAIFY